MSAINRKKLAVIEILGSIIIMVAAVASIASLGLFLDVNEKMSLWESIAALMVVAVLLTTVILGFSRLRIAHRKLVRISLIEAQGIFPEDLDASFSWSFVQAGHFKFRGRFGTEIVEHLPSFRVSIHLVTNKQYKIFIDSDIRHRPPAYWQDRSYPEGKAKHPVVNVSLEDAIYYCIWLSKATGNSYRLPNEHEWEKAARGENGRDFPWEEQQFDPQKCNSAESRIDDTTPVDQYENGTSPYGCYDMVGNVSEWTESIEDGFAVIRGSSYKVGEERSNCLYRVMLDPADISETIGFRVVKQVE